MNFEDIYCINYKIGGIKPGKIIYLLLNLKKIRKPPKHKYTKSDSIQKILLKHVI